MCSIKSASQPTPKKFPEGNAPTTRLSVRVVVASVCLISYLATTNPQRSSFHPLALSPSLIVIVCRSQCPVRGSFQITPRSVRLSRWWWWFSASAATSPSFPNGTIHRTTCWGSPWKMCRPRRLDRRVFVKTHNKSTYNNNNGPSGWPREYRVSGCCGQWPFGGNNARSI